MRNGEEQAAEIKTIKPRTFTLELSDADVKRLYEKAYSNGITPAELLEGFIGDLTDGTYSHGSDEREQANGYFERCCYDLMSDNTLLQWALSWYRLDDIADALEVIDDMKSELEYLTAHPDETEPGELQAAQDDIDSAESELKAIYEEYKADKGKEPYSDGIEAIRRYMRELQAMTERGAI